MAPTVPSGSGVIGNTKTPPRTNKIPKTKVDGSDEKVIQETMVPGNTIVTGKTKYKRKKVPKINEEKVKEETNSDSESDEEVDGKLVNELQKTMQTARKVIKEAKKRDTCAVNWQLTVPAHCTTEYDLSETLKKHSKYFIFQLEQGTGEEDEAEWFDFIDNKYVLKRTAKVTKEVEEAKKQGYQHYQGFFKLKTKERFTSLKAKLPKEFHFEKANNEKACIGYCKKNATKIGKTYEWTQGEEEIWAPIPEASFHPWQKDVNTFLKEKPDDRTIHWIIDIDGHAGKTTLNRWFFQEDMRAVLAHGTEGDIFFKISQALEVKRPPRIVVVDLPRKGDPDDAPYETLETIKNGLLAASKYESKDCLFNPPHCVVFANWGPDTSSLSLDRWQIWQILDDLTLKNVFDGKKVVKRPRSKFVYDYSHLLENNPKHRPAKQHEHFKADKKKIEEPVNKSPFKI